MRYCDRVLGETVHHHIIHYSSEVVPCLNFCVVRIFLTATGPLIKFAKSDSVNFGHEGNGYMKHTEAEDSFPGPNEVKSVP